MAKPATLVRRGKIENAFEYCAIAALITLVSLGGTNAFGPHLGIVVNNASRLAE
jgi:hypothetical protein